MQGKYSIKQLIAHKGFYCQIILDVNVNSASEKGGIKLIGEIEEQWRSSVTFACDYFYEKYFIRNDVRKEKNILVQIVNLEYMVIDTTIMLVAYSTIKALEDALQFQIEDVNISEDGKIYFPK